jgi:HK97 family phage prohead protease
MSIPEKYSHIDFKPPSGVKREAEYGLKLRREHGRGGTAVGIARARDLANGVQLSPSTIRRMKAFFDRHQSDEKAEGFNRGDKNYPSNGLIANKLWGGPSGYSYAKKVVEQMNAADEKEGRALRPFGSTQGIKPNVFVVHGPPASGKTSYVMQNKGENDVVFDFDKVMSALSGLPPHQKNNNLISYCTDIRTLIIEKALRSPKVDKTWIISTNVGDDMKGQLSDIPVEYIHIDTPKEECLKRIEEDPERQPVAEELRQVVERYFEPKPDEQRSAPVQPNVERRFLGNFSHADAQDPGLLKVERRADPATGKPQTYVVGYAARFGKDSLLMGDFVERIDPAAFDLVESRTDSEGRPLETRCLFNHDPNHLLGRFPTTMKMYVDEKGLRYECSLPESRSDIAESIARGDLKGSSFSFVVADGGEKWTYENGRSMRLVTKIKSLLDCGPVTYPAYGDATVAVAKRSYQQFVAEKSSRSESRNAAKAKAAEELAKTREFLESRAFCKTGAGGGVDNSCGKDGEAGAGGGSEPESGGRLAAAVKGAAVGAAAGALGGGLVGAAIGATALGFAAYVASGKKTDEALEKAKGDMGLDDNKLNVAAAAVLAKGNKPQEIKTRVTKDGVISMTSHTGQMHISSKPPYFGIKGKSNLHLDAFGGGKTTAKDAELAAKSVGVKTVTVQSWNRDIDAGLKAAGFTKTGGSKSKSGYASKSEDHDVWIKDLSKKSSKRSIEELTQFVSDRRAFCPKGEGNGIDNSCSSGGKSSGGSEKYTPKEDDGDVFSKYGNGPAVPKADLSKYGSGPIVPKVDVEKLKSPGKTATDIAPQSTLGAKKSGSAAYDSITKKVGTQPKPKTEPAKYVPKKDDGDVFSKYGKGPIVPQADAGKYGKGPIVPSVDVEAVKSGKSTKPTGKYMEWDKTKDNKSPTKTAKAQDFLDKAREEQMSKGGKAEGMADEGGGVQTWSKGDTFPWTPKQVGTDEGYVQGLHPDGSKTEKYPFSGGKSSEAFKKMGDEIKRKKGKRSHDPRQVARDTIEFLKARRA